MNKKGFTLIELLAVIVILAVIALIATPIIMNVINDAREGAAKDSMYSYVKAVELKATQELKSDLNMLSGTYETIDGHLYGGQMKKMDVNLKGIKPDDNVGTITLNNGVVTSASLKFDGYDIDYDGNNSKIGAKKYSVGDVIYFDPTGKVADCKAGKEWTANNTVTTCYKWNVIKDKGSSIEMLLDHNLEKNVAWISKDDYIALGGSESGYGSYGDNSKGPKTAVKQMKNDTSSWTKVETLTSADNIQTKRYLIEYSGMKARLINVQEILSIVKNNTWSQTGDAIDISKAPWLYQNLDNIASTIQQYGYWSATDKGSYANYAWYVGYYERYATAYVKSESSMGIRPIVRVLKSNI